MALRGAIRPTRLALRGRYSAMMDLGGVAAADVKNQHIDKGKNSKIRAVALDFDLLVRNLDAQRAQAQQQVGLPSAKAIAGQAGSANIDTSASSMPNVGMVEHMGKLLNVDLGGTIKGRKDEDEDDLSKLTGGTAAVASSSASAAGLRPQEVDEIGSSIFSNLSSSSSKSNSRPKPKPTATASTKAPPVNDPRAKYADKLRKKLDGGLAGVENAKFQQEEALKRGDAAGHLAARAIASATPVGTGSKWLAATGTGHLLAYLTNRSMKIALLPIPDSADETSNDAAARRMDDLEQQLPQVRFDLLVKDGQRPPSDIMGDVQSKTDVAIGSLLVVSDRDDYLREAKERGHYTCRVRPKNAPRGNVTTNYTVSSISEIEDVCNELNGISFNTVFSGVGINHGGV